MVRGLVGEPPQAQEHGLGGSWHDAGRCRPLATGASADRQAERAIQRIVHALFVGHKIVDLALDRVALLVSVATAAVQLLQLL